MIGRNTSLLYALLFLFLANGSATARLMLEAVWFALEHSPDEIALNPPGCNASHQANPLHLSGHHGEIVLCFPIDCGGGGGKDSLASTTVPPGTAAMDTNCHGHVEQSIMRVQVRHLRMELC